MRAQALAFDAYGTLFDLAAIDEAAEQAFPGQGGEIGAVWRRKQLEYSWLRSLMGRYVPFWQVTREALTYALRVHGHDPTTEATDALLSVYLRLPAFDEVTEALVSLRPRQLVIFSNGDPDMLAPLLAAAGLENSLDDVLSVEAAGVFKPSPEAYALAPERLELPPEEIMLVSANPFDVAGAKSFGLRAAWVRRGESHLEELGLAPDVVVGSLSELPRLLGGPA